jgi:hypothetical protein
MANNNNRQHKEQRRRRRRRRRRRNNGLHIQDGGGIKWEQYYEIQRVHNAIGNYDQAAVNNMSSIDEYNNEVVLLSQNVRWQLVVVVIINFLIAVLP